ncbi:hypothetical protein ACYBKW_002994, partial [Escherichia coli]
IVRVLNDFQPKKNSLGKNSWAQFAGYRLSNSRIFGGKNGAKCCKRGKNGATKEWVIVAYCCC